MKTLHHISGMSTRVWKQGAGHGCAPSSITFMTWNVANFDTHPLWYSRCKAIATAINFHKPDFIALQELRERYLPPRFALDDIMNHLEGDYYYHYEPAAEFRVLGLFVNTTEGLGILSKHPINGIRSAKLSPAEDDDNQRICLEVMLDIGGAELSVAVEHLTFDNSSTQRQLLDVWDFLSARPSQLGLSTRPSQLGLHTSATVRHTCCCQARRVQPAGHRTCSTTPRCTLTRSQSTTSTDISKTDAQAAALGLPLGSQPRRPQLLLGDFNIPVDQQHLLDFMLGRATCRGVRGDFSDAAEALGLAYAQVLSWPSDCPESALDRVLFRGPPEFRPVSYAVEAAVAEGQLAPSDHLYVLCSFAWPWGPSGGRS